VLSPQVDKMVSTHTAPRTAWHKNEEDTHHVHTLDA
jgi:hypothetical protein